MPAMSTSQPQPVNEAPQAGPAIVVGYDGSAGSADALRWAIDHAPDHGNTIWLVSALDDSYVAAGPNLPYFPHVPSERESLDKLRETEQKNHPEITFEVDIRLGPAIKLLLEQATRGDLMVMGKCGLGAFGRIALGSVSIGVAGRCQVPVVIVPRRWESTDHDHDPVVVGLHPFRSNQTTLDFGFAEAVRRGVHLRVVDAKGVAPILTWDSTAARPSYLVTRRRERVEDELDLFRSRYPGVTVTVEQDSTHPVDALLKHAEGAQLLVIGRHHSGLTGFGAGSVCRGVLHHVETPAAVVPARP